MDSNLKKRTKNTFCCFVDVVVTGQAVCKRWPFNLIRSPFSVKFFKIIFTFYYEQPKVKGNYTYLNVNINRQYTKWKMCTEHTCVYARFERTNTTTTTKEQIDIKQIHVFLFFSSDMKRLNVYSPLFFIFLTVYK